MIKAVIYKDENNVIRGFCVKGHAGFLRNGKDIVCSAVSMLVINTVNSLELLSEDKSFVENDEKTGMIKLKLSVNEEGKTSKEAEILLKSLVLGLQAVSEKYGKYIELSEERIK